MRVKVVVLATSTMVLLGCMVSPRPRSGYDIIPILPVHVELDDDSHYSQDGYHYYYTNDRWYYAETRNGHRKELPRSHWPKETKRRGHGGRR